MQCQRQIPDDIVQTLEKLPDGIKPVIENIEKEFGLSTSVKGGQMFIAGPSSEILQLAIETLERRFIVDHDAKDGSEEGIIHELEDKRTVWKFFGNYARKISHLFMSELKDLQQVDSVVVKDTKNCLEITCSYDDTDVVKGAVRKLEHDLHELFEQDVKLPKNGNDIIRIRRYIDSKHKHDKTVLMVLNNDGTMVRVSGKTKPHVDKIVDELRTGKATGTLVLPFLTKSKKFKHQLRLPSGIVKKMEKQKGGIFPIISMIEREFGLEVNYIRDKHFVLFGPSMEVLDLMAQTLVLRYVIKKLPLNSITGMLQRQNAIWKFSGEYAKKLNHLFKKELAYIERIKTVTVRAFPCQLNPTAVEILCSVKYAGHVKEAIEKLTGMLHELFEQKVTIPDCKEDKQNVREFVRYSQEMDNTVLCMFDEEANTLTVSGRNYFMVRQVASKVKDMVATQHQSVPVPQTLKDSYRQQYQTQLGKTVVAKLEKQPGGLTPIMQRIEKEYGLKTVYHKDKVALVSPSQEVLELATETLLDRYANDLNKPHRLGAIRKKKLSA